MINEDLNIPTSDKIILSDENMSDFKKAVKIGYYKSFFNNGIITAPQFQKLMQLQNKEE